jgi:hypothetical protein
MCTNTGCFVEAKARTVCRTPRVNLLKLLALGIEIQTVDYIVLKNSFQTKQNGCGTQGTTANGKSYKASS